MYMATKTYADQALMKAAFQARTEQYLRLGFDRFAAADFVAGTGKQLASPALDIGTGRGMMAMALARRGLNVVSVDINEDDQALALLLAAEAGLEKRIQFVCTDASALSFPAGYFACTVMMDVLHHLEDPVSVLEETARVLRLGGLLILADFSLEGFDLVAQVHQEEGREHLIRGITLSSAEEMLCSRGFEVTTHLSGHKHEVTVLSKKRK